MAAIPRELIESELFGHEKGAFTGAQARTQGRFEQAEGGTLFLDEIGDMPLEAQTRLLRVLQEGEYTTVGGRTPIKTNVRIIAATHRDLKAQIQQGLFREDLFYRLNVVPLRIPPLRERIEDIGDLVRHFLRQAAREGLGQKSIETAAIDRLKAHPWPGNVRELENFVRRLVALYPQEALTRPHRRAGARGGLAAAPRRREVDGAQGPLRDGRALPGRLFRQLRQGAAAARALRPRHPRGRAAAAQRGAGGHARQPDPRGRASWSQPQYAAKQIKAWISVCSARRCAEGGDAAVRVGRADNLRCARHGGLRSAHRSGPVYSWRELDAPLGGEYRSVLSRKCHSLLMAELAVLQMGGWSGGRLGAATSSPVLRMRERRCEAAEALVLPG